MIKRGVTEPGRTPAVNAEGPCDKVDAAHEPVKSGSARPRPLPEIRDGDTTQEPKKKA